jgi:hypothetical protein
MLVFLFHVHLYRTIRYIAIVIRSKYDISLIVNGAKSGAYSQVYPMTLSANAFDLWALYARQSGWMEIPAHKEDSQNTRWMIERVSFPSSRHGAGLHPVKWLEQFDGVP